MFWTMSPTIRARWLPSSRSLSVLRFTEPAFDYVRVRIGRHRRKVISQKVVDEPVAPAYSLKKHPFRRVIQEPGVPPGRQSKARQNKSQGEMLNARSSRNKSSQQPEYDSGTQPDIDPIQGARDNTGHERTSEHVQEAVRHADNQTAEQREHPDIDRRLPNTLIRYCSSLDIRACQAPEHTKERTQKRTDGNSQSAAERGTEGRD
jgi:hypothetical protein